MADLEVTTRGRYEDLVRLHIATRLGSQQVARIDAELLERFYARLELTGPAGIRIVAVASTVC